VRTLTADGAKTKLTERQLNRVVKALRSALDKETDDDEKYELAVLVDRLTPKKDPAKSGTSRVDDVLKR
jgi:hypothetical protein